MEARRLLGSEEFSEDLLGVMFLPPPFTSVHTCKPSAYETCCACLWQSLYRLCDSFTESKPSGPLFESLETFATI